MSTRQLFSRSHSASLQVSDLVGSLLALELLAPSRELYLISPWVSDVPVIRNSQAEVRALVPDLGGGDLWLSDVLRRLADRGTVVRVVCRPDAGNDDLLRRLGDRVERRQHTTLHAKGLLTDRAYLSGSMNFTHSGFTLNDETVEVTTNPQRVAAAHLDFAAYWRTLPCRP